MACSGGVEAAGIDVFVGVGAALAVNDGLAVVELLALVIKDGCDWPVASGEVVAWIDCPLRI